MGLLRRDEVRLCQVTAADGCDVREENPNVELVWFSCSKAVTISEHCRAKSIV